MADRQNKPFRWRVGVVRPLMLAAGLSMLGAGGLAYAASGQDDGKQEVKTVHKKVIVVSSGGSGSTVIRKGGKIIVSNGDVPADMDPSYVETVHAKAIRDARAALESVEARIKKTRSTDDRKALELARDSLKGAIDALEAEPTTYVMNGMEPFDLDESGLEGSLKELRLHEGKIKSMRIELHRDLERARDDIAEALERFDIEVDTKGDITRLRVKELRDAAADLDRTEEEQMKALDKAEQELKRARAELEKRIEERKAHDADKAPQK